MLTTTSAFSKIVKASLLLIPFAVWSFVLFAQEPDDESISKLNLPASALELGHQNSGWGASALFSFVEYSEPSLMTESGPLVGMGLSYTYAFRDNPVVLRLEGEYHYGQLTYNGSTSTGTPMTAPAEDNILNGRALLGFQAQPTDRINIGPFLGVAARYLNDLIQGGYDREITYLYLPIGANLTFGLSNRWLLSVGGEYDYFISGSAVSHLNQSNSEFPTVYNTQSNGYGYRLTAGLARSFEKWTLNVSPYISCWSVQQSDIQTFSTSNGPMSAWEPENTSTMYGVKFSARF